MRRATHLFRNVLLCAAVTSPLYGASAPVLACRVVGRFPHDASHYTEGLLYLNGLLYEGTGIAGQSEVVVTDPGTGKILQHVSIPPEYFGEGIVDWGPNLLEWTWQSHTGFVLDRFSLRTLREFHYTGEGWGMTHTARELITSDGTATLRFRNPETFQETRSIEVKDGGVPVQQLNELEYIRGAIYANVWHTDRIARISPRDGRVLAWLDLTGLLPESERMNSESVLNGIAYDAEHDRILVTGKQWPWVFQIVPVEPAAKQR